MSEPRGARAWLTVLFGVLFVVALTGWLFTSGLAERVLGFATVACGVVLVVVAVVSAIVEHQPGCVLVVAAYAGVGVLLTAVVFGFAYLDASWTYVQGTSTEARVLSCADDDLDEDDEGDEDADGDECEFAWDGRRGEVELALDVKPGDTIPVRAHGDDAVREGGLTVMVVASSGVALVSPLLAIAAFVLARRQRT